MYIFHFIWVRLLFLSLSLYYLLIRMRTYEANIECGKQSCRFRAQSDISMIFFARVFGMFVHLL